MILAAIDEAVAAGARLSACCKVVEVDARTTQRWRANPEGEDRRRGPRTVPRNKLTPPEEERIIEVVTSPEYRDLSPKQIVPQLADQGLYLGSESTIYRLLKRHDLAAHRGPCKPREVREVKELRATAPLQVWTWDISYLRGPKAGIFYYLYLIVDVWSRKIVGHRVEAIECGELASMLAKAAITTEGATAAPPALHMDNGSPMKSAPFKATLEALGVMPSYSRPRVSNDNPYSESLFRTLKYRPAYPRKGFVDLESARRWVDDFVAWYNDEHLHSAIGYVTPAERHAGLDSDKLARRRAIYKMARRCHPERWTGATRAWTSPDTVLLNPAKTTNHSSTESSAQPQSA